MEEQYLDIRKIQGQKRQRNIFCMMGKCRSLWIKKYRVLSCLIKRLLSVVKMYFKIKILLLPCSKKLLLIKQMCLLLLQLYHLKLKNKGKDNERDKDKDRDRGKKKDKGNVRDSVRDKDRGRRQRVLYLLQHQSTTFPHQSNKISLKDMEDGSEVFKCSISYQIVVIQLKQFSFM